MTNLNTVSRRFATITKTASLGFTSCAAAIMLLSISVLGSSLAQADQATSGSRSKQVSFAGLDLSTVEGQQIARARVHEMARTLCSQVADSHDLSHQPNYVACIDTAVAQAGERLQALISKHENAKFARNDNQ
jgi:UrcA family protein